MHSFNFNIKDPTNKFIYLLPYKLKDRFDLTDKYLVDPFLEKGGKLKDLTHLFLSPTDKANADYYKKQLSLITKLLKATQAPYLYIMDATLFTKLTGKKSPSKYYGLPIKCQLEDSPDTLCFIGVNPESALISDTLSQGLHNSINTFTNCVGKRITPYSPQILKHTQFIFDFDEAISKLQEYFYLPIIACDIETKSLKPSKTGIETIAFARSPYEGFAICVDRNEPAIAKKMNGLLKAFFKLYEGTYIWHGGKFDRKIITNSYFTFDENRMLSNKQHEDTIVMAYCCMNSVEKPRYGLKDLGFEFIGDYGIDVSDTTSIDINVLMDYNIHDACTTFYLYEKFSKLIKEENQEDIYRNIFMPSITTLIKTELHGIPVSPTKTKEFIKFITADRDRSLKRLEDLPLIKNFTDQLKQEACDKRNTKLVKKVVEVTDDEFDEIVFNPNSSVQLQKLLFDVLGLPVLGKTDKGAPSTDK